METTKLDTIAANGLTKEKIVNIAPKTLPIISLGTLSWIFPK